MRNACSYSCSWAYSCSYTRSLAEEACAYASLADSFRSLQTAHKEKLPCDDHEHAHGPGRARIDIQHSGHGRARIDIQHNGHVDNCYDFDHTDTDSEHDFVFVLDFPFSSVFHFAFDFPFSLDFQPPTFSSSAPPPSAS